jgi:hypothetical protein
MLVGAAGSAKLTFPLTTSVKAAALVVTSCCPKAQVSAAENPNPSTSEGTMTTSLAKI